MYTEEELLLDLVEMNEKAGGNISAEEYSRLSKHDSSTLRRRFGSFNNAKVRAGLANERN